METRINFAGIDMKNPVTVASGTFGYGREFSDFVNLNDLGAFITKGTTLKPKSGNKPTRICETPSGILHNIGVQNPGIEYFAKYELPYLKKFDTKIIVNACANKTDEFIELGKVLNDLDIDGVEVNLSCPNYDNDGKIFSYDYDSIDMLIKNLKKVLKKPIIAKLSPNVPDIELSAIAAENGGADAISLINAISGMAIDIHKQEPILSTKIGGLSGPAIKPVAVRMVYQIAQKVNIPILGMGGILTGEDAIEFMLAGSTAVAIGAGNFANPFATLDVIKGIEEYMKEKNVKDIYQIIGKLK